MKTPAFLFHYQPIIDLLDGLSDGTRERWMERYQIMTAEGVDEEQAFELIKKYIIWRIK